MNKPVVAIAAVVVLLLFLVAVAFTVLNDSTPVAAPGAAGPGGGERPAAPGDPRAPTTTIRFPSTTRLDSGAVVADSFGDDPALDELWLDCEVGLPAACDLLYQRSPSRSGYEEFGATCGWRTQPSGYCANRFPRGFPDS